MAAIVATCQAPRGWKTTQLGFLNFDRMILTYNQLSKVFLLSLFFALKISKPKVWDLYVYNLECERVDIVSRDFSSCHSPTKPKTNKIIIQN